MRSRLAIAASILALAAMAGSGCVAFPTDPLGRNAQFCVTQGEGEPLLCCPSPGLGCQAAEATQ